MSYAGKRVLVIGGTGFIGGRLAERLLVEHHARVRVSVRDWRKAVWIARTTAELVPGDVTDVEAMTSAARGCDIVFHCASGSADSGGYMRTNRDGTRNVIDACIKADVARLVFVSTVAVHGARPGLTLSSKTPMTESGRDYNDSKIEAERLVATAHANGRLGAVIMRPTYVWGPRSNAFTVRQVRELSAGTYKYVDGGASVANAVYIDNLVDALILAGTCVGAEGDAFLVTDDADYRWCDFIGHYAQYLGIRDVQSVSSRSLWVRYGCKAVDKFEKRLNSLKGEKPFPVRVFRRLVKVTRDQLRRHFVDSTELNKFSYDGIADISDTKKVLGYSPRIDLATGMAITLQWLDDQYAIELDRSQIPV